LQEGSCADNDASNGWEAVAAKLIARRDRSLIGAATVRRWAQSLPKGATILDLGCGSGVPMCAMLANDGFNLYGVDASPTLVAEFRSRCPGATVACEAVESSPFFGRNFDAVMAIGLMFLLAEKVQKAVIRRIAAALEKDGRFLFTSPSQACTWADSMTGRQSCSLGADAYAHILSGAGLTLTSEHADEGENHYYDSVKR
jgi:2-polyprenyl-3-methyl-5-hydroxy-6-metoxy-1,4-benzoquinol methylase